MAQDGNDGAPGGTPINWEVVGQILGGTAAIAGWIAVVGGGEVWARLHAAHIPATQTLSVLPRQLLLVQGLQTLLVPLLIGGGAALLIYFSWPEREEDDKRPMLKGEAIEAEKLRLAEARGADTADDAEKSAAAAHEAEASEETLPNAVKQARGAPPESLRALPKKPEPDDSREQRLDEREPDDSQEPDDPEKPEPEDKQAKEIESRIPAPLLLLEGAVIQYGGRTVALVGAVCAFLLLGLTLAIVQIHWWWALAAIIVGLVLAGAAVTSSGSRQAWLLVCAALAPFVVLFVAVAIEMKVGYIVAMALVTVGAAWITLGALVNRGRSAIAVTLFVALALWAGALGILRALGARHPELETAEVLRKNASPLTGYYIGGAGGDVYIASLTAPRKVTLVKEEDVSSLSFGTAVAVDRKEAKNEHGKPPGVPVSQGGNGEPPPAPDPTLEHPSASANGSLDGVPVLLEVMQPQFGRQLMVLNLRLTNRTDPKDALARTLVVGGLLDDGAAERGTNAHDTLDGLSVADLDGSNRHAVAHDTTGRCLCSHGLDRLTIGPGEAVRLYATFYPAPEDRHFVLQVDGIGSIPVGP